MDLKKEKINIILISTSIVLFFTYILSFTNFSSTDKRKLVKSALVNSKYEKSINKFELSQGLEKLFLSKYSNNNGEIWFITTENNEKIIPADKEIVNNFIKKLISVINMYKVSDKVSQNNSFGLTSEDTFCLKYYFSDSEFQQIYFGNLDFSNSFRYLMSGKNTTVYQVENTIDTYLNTKVQFWAEPNIISKQIINISPESIQKISCSTQNTKKSFNSKTSNFYEKCYDLLSLRHGGISQLNTEILEKKSILEIENGDKTSITINFYKQKDEFVLEAIYNLNSTKVKTISKISKWTYNKISEIFEIN